MSLGKTISCWSLNFLIYTVETGALLPDYPSGLRVKRGGATRVLVGGAPLGMSREAAEGKKSQLKLDPVPADYLSSHLHPGGLGVAMPPSLCSDDQ